MRSTCLLFLTLIASLAARADFSYTTTTKSTGGAMAAAGPGAVTKNYLKGQKMRIDRGDSIMILDFEAQTMTRINPTAKTYTVSKFADMGNDMSKAGVEVNIDVKETGQKRTINGFNASEMVMTMEMENPQSRQSGTKMKMEMDIWVSADVPGAQEMRAFYQRNAGRFPWAAMAGGGRGNPSVQKAIADLQRKMADLKGVPVLQVMKLGGAGNEQQMAQMQQGMAKAQAQLEEMKRQGKLPPQMEEQLKRMQAMSGGGSMFETTMESSGFSDSRIPDSLFEIPAGYQEGQR